MKYLKLSSFIVAVIFSSNILFSQNSIQFDHGISNTLHYNSPVNLSVCFEGCFPEEQEAKLASNFDISFYRLYNKKSSFKVGVGYAEYRFLEKGLASQGDNSLLPYEHITEYKYFNISCGYKYNLPSFKMLNPFIETAFIFEYSPEEKDYNLKKYGVAHKSQIGTSISLSEKWNMIFSAFFKTGIMKYNKTHNDLISTYVPYGYGIQISFSANL